jgi:hypothetical protein
LQILAEEEKNENKVAQKKRKLKESSFSFLNKQYVQMNMTDCSQVGCWWLTLVIFPTWEAEVGRIAVLDQPGQKAHLSQ